jgi:phosphatidate cytidylyltransferase
MLKYRLLLGTLMTIVFVGLMVLDGWLDGSLAGRGHGHIQGTILCAFMILLMLPAQLELSKLAQAAGYRIFTIITIPASMLLATCWYWPQLFCIDKAIYVLFVSAFAVSAVFLYQANRFGTQGVLGNCGASFLSLLYLGLLSAFTLGLRVDFGVWALLMFVFAVKTADIGAYAIGRLLGKHKFSPVISPGKTWEGMAGAVIFAAATGSIFAFASGIMALWAGAIFGVVFAFIGQLGDLAESMIKREAQQKDSSHSVPGFGGVLDVIDSPLIAAPFAYLFFMVACSGTSLWN